MFLNKFVEYPADDSDLLLGARDQDHALVRDAFALSVQKQLSRSSLCVDQHSAKTIRRRATQFKSLPRKTSKPGPDLGRKFPAVLSCHRPFQGLHDQSRHTEIGRAHV